MLSKDTNRVDGVFMRVSRMLEVFQGPSCGEIWQTLINNRDLDLIIRIASCWMCDNNNKTSIWIFGVSKLVYK